MAAAWILVATAKRTNGYCMPHAEMGWSFDKRFGGIMDSVEEVSLPDITTMGVLWDVLTTDKVVRFHTRPSSPDQKKYASTGYAFVRNDEWVDGIVAEWESDPEYWMDIINGPQPAPLVVKNF